MNKMVIGGVNNQVFVASNLGRIEHFYSVLLGLPRRVGEESTSTVRVPLAISAVSGCVPV
jgi:hypothetical protein